MKRNEGKKWLLGILMCLMFVLVMVPSQNAQAASNKTKALKAYRSMLAKKTLKVNDWTTYQTKNCRFAIAYIDDNSVPELIVYNDKDVSHFQGFGALYTYHKGKVQLVSTLTLDTRSRLGYYKRTGWFMDNTTYQGYGTDTIQKLAAGKLKTNTVYYRSVEYNGSRYVITGFSMMANGSYQSYDATTFNRSLTHNTKGEKFRKFKFYKNTKKNRLKYLK